MALGHALHDYAVRLGNDDRLRYPPMRGGRLWRSLVETSPPLLDPAHLLCPASRDGYRGPAGDPARIDQAGPLGADPDPGHAPLPGNVLLKRGDVHAVHRDHPLWLEAARTTLP